MGEYQWKQNIDWNKIFLINFQKLSKEDFIPLKTQKIQDFQLEEEQDLIQKNIIRAGISFWDEEFYFRMFLLQVLKDKI